MAGRSKVIGKCLCCGEAVRNLSGASNNPSKATEIRIGGYFGSTEFDGSDMTGEFLWALLCDRCLKERRGRCTQPLTAPNWAKTKTTK